MTDPTTLHNRLHYLSKKRCLGFVKIALSFISRLSDKNAQGKSHCAGMSKELRRRTREETFISPSPSSFPSPFPRSTFISVDSCKGDLDKYRPVSNGSEICAGTIFQICKMVSKKLCHIFYEMNDLKGTLVICCKSTLAIFWSLDYFQNGGNVISF